jgi:hypothetical protein
MIIRPYSVYAVLGRLKAGLFESGVAGKIPEDAAFP